VLLRHPALEDDELASTARSVVGSLASVTMSGPGTVELQPLGITKATGLALAARHLGLTPSDTIAFGDMPNDIPMFDWAAHGVAMANAHPELKAVADEVTSSNEDDGIAVVRKTPQRNALLGARGTARPATTARAVKQTTRRG
jgi:hydroxymethylpyrimidine pyrophosphatase-like HAD family hydrolase